MIVSPQRRPHEAGRRRPHLGRHRRPRRLRRASTSSTAAAPPSAWCRSPEKVELLHELGLSSTSSTARRPATGSGPTSTPRTRREWRRLGKDIRALIGEDPDIVFEHPGRQTMGASVFVCRPRRHDRHLRGHQRLHDRVRQPAPLDEAQEHQVARTSPTTARRGRPTGSSPRARSSRSSRPVHPLERGRRGRLRRSTTTCTRARSACCAWRPRRASASTTPSSASKVGEDKITLFRRHGA